MVAKKLRDWLEVIGLFSVVASLVFVGLQLKQSHEIAIASQYHARAELAVQNFNAQLESGNLEQWGRIGRLEVSPDFTVEDAGRFYLMGVSYLTMADNHYFQYQSGFMDEESWQTQRQMLKRVTGGSGPPAHILQYNLHEFRPSFLELLQEISDERVSE